MNKDIANTIAEIEKLASDCEATREVFALLGDVESIANECNDNEKSEIADSLWRISNAASLLQAIQLKSFAVDLLWSYEYLIEYYKYIIANSDEIPADTLYFLQAQECAKIFMHQALNGYESKYYSWVLLEKCLSKFSDQVGDDLLSPIPCNQRNKELVFVFTNQFLSMTHGPTKTALDRCEVLYKKLGKRIILINTGECLSLRGGIPIRNMNIAHYNDDLCKVSDIDYNGINVTFYQCENIMPDVNIIRMILELIRNQRPEFLVNIGGDDITSNLAAKIIPAISIDLCPSETTATFSACQTVTRPLIDEDYELLDKMSIPRWHYLPATFTSSLREQNETHSRDEIGISDNVFVAGIVGARLDVEITDDFLSMLSNASSKYNVEYLMMGQFTNMDMIEEKYPLLATKIHYVGFVSDALSYLELCDIFINPIRRGGGTSAIEALYKGCPVLTTPFGDTSTGVGEDFWTDSYDTMLDLIGRYATDKAFLDDMSVKARRRAEDMLDSFSHFVDVINKFNEIIVEKEL